MPVVISHSLVAIVFGKIFAKKTGIKFWVFSIICAILPDIDVLMQYTGLPYGHMLGHRGFFHSIMFVLILAFIIVITGFHEIKRLSKEWWSFVVYFFLIGLSHTILDAMTSEGIGVGLFMPFDSARYFLPVRPIRMSPFSILRFLKTDSMRILVSELILIWIPSVMSLIIIWFVKKCKNFKGTVINDPHSE
jgi:inner membrane protein